MEFLGGGLAGGGASWRGEGFDLKGLSFILSPSLPLTTMRRATLFSLTFLLHVVPYHCSGNHGESCPLSEPSKTMSQGLDMCSSVLLDWGPGSSMLPWLGLGSMLLGLGLASYSFVTLKMG